MLAPELNGIFKIKEYLMTELMVEQRIQSIQKKTIYAIWLQAFLSLFFLGIIVFSIMIYMPADVIQSLKQGQATPTPQTDFLKLSMPIMAIFIGFMISFLGLRRLGQFDEEINNLRSFLNNQLSEERTFNEGQRERFRKEINIRLDEIKSTIQVVAENHVMQAVDERVGKFQGEQETYIVNTKQIVKTIREKLEPYEWLSNKKDEADNLSAISSIGEAHDQASNFYRERKIDLAVRVAEHALQNNIRGSASDYHNLAAEMAKNDHYDLASKIVSAGVEHFPKNVDLLSDGVKYLSESGEIDEAEEYRLRLETIEKKFWNWRAFVFIGDFFELQGKYDQAASIYDQFKVSIPHDERAYSQHGGMFSQLGHYDQAIDILEEGLKRTTKAPQTALLLSQAYFQVGLYHKAVDVVNRGLEGSAEAQPSVNISSLFWTRAQCRDALCYKTKNSQELENLIELSIFDYEMCMSMFEAIEHYKLRGLQRVNMLKAMGKSAGISSYVNFDNDQIQPDQMLKLLSELSEVVSDSEAED